MFFSIVFVATLAVSASALATPHVPSLTRRHQHAALVKARSPVPDPVALAQPVDPSAALPKKRLGKRCKARSPQQTPPALPSAPVNVGAAPSSSHKASPPPSHSSSPPPPPQFSQAAPPKPSPPPPPSPPSSGDPFGLLSGDGTFFATGLGACGVTNNDSQFIAAVSELLFDTYPEYDGTNPNSNPICGRKARATYQGKSVEVTITDRCTACKYGSLDFSLAAFKQLADPTVGRIHDMEWQLLSL